MSDAADEPITTLDPIGAAPKRRSPVPIVLGVVAVLALLVGVFVIARDGDGGANGDPLELLSSAPDAARDAGSARMKMTMSMGGDGFSMDIGGEGLVDFETGAGSFEMSMMGVDINVISDGETVWLQLPAGEVDGRSWVAVPAEAMEGQQVGDIRSTAGLLDALRGTGVDIDELGTEEVNGVEATHYSAEVDLADAVANAPEAQREETRAALEQLNGLGLDEAAFPIDAWITDDGLPVRVVMSFSPPKTGEAASLLGDFELKMQIDMTDFGTAVEIDPPDPADVREIDDPAEIAELFGGGLGGLEG